MCSSIPSWTLATFAALSAAGIGAPEADSMADVPGRGAPERDAAATGPRAQEAAVITPERIDIRVQARPDSPIVLIEADLRFRVDEPNEVVTLFLRPDLTLDVIEDVDGVPLAYRRGRGQSSRLRITSPPLARGASTTWTFRYRARFPATLAEAGQVLLTTPWYPHLRVIPDPQEFQRFVPMPMSLTATLPDPWVLVSSGTNRKSQQTGASTYTWSDSVPNSAIPLVIGQFVEDDKLDHVGIVRSFLSPANRSLGSSYVDYIRAAATFFSERIGVLNRRSWNLVEVDLPETMSGLTLPGLTLLEADGVSRDMAFPYRILAHEIAHQWWNFYIEIPRARDAWLREGLPTYSSLMFLENQYGAEMMRQELERSKRVALSVMAPEPLEVGFEMAAPGTIYALNYHKAAVVLHMLRGVIGLDAFVDLLQALHSAGSDVTTEVFVTLAQELHGGDLSWFFDAWLTRTDVPSFHVRYGYGPLDGVSSRYELRGVIEQRDASIRHPVTLRVSLDAAPPLETTVWIEAGTTEFTIALPSRPTNLTFDPAGDLLYREVTVEFGDRTATG